MNKQTKTTAILALILLLAACNAPQPQLDNPPAAPNDNAPAGDAQAVSAAGGEVDLTQLPLGDDNVSSSPQVGYLYSCQTTFNGAGAFNDGEWIKADGTYDLTAKAVVDGSVNWDGEYTISLQGDQRVIDGNQLPDHPTGIYPVSSDDDAYNYDRNPNSISAQDFNLTLPANPTLAAEPSCVSMGTVGFMLTGSVFFNAVDALGRDAVAHEIQDSCGGHPEMTGSYHYHNLTACIDGDEGSGHSDLLGYVLDGFGIYGHLGGNGETLTNADLDECHGHTHDIEWDGQVQEMFHYHATWEYPYTIGCYRGTPVTTAGQGAGGQGPGDGQGPGGPPQGGQRPGGPPPSGALLPDGDLSPLVAAAISDSNQLFI